MYLPIITTNTNTSIPFSPLAVLIVVSQSSLVELLKLPAQPRYSAVGLVDCAGRLYRSASAEESKWSLEAKLHSSQCLVLNER